MIYSQMHALFNWSGSFSRPNVALKQYLALDDQDGWQVQAQAALDVLAATTELREQVLSAPANQRGEVFKALRKPFSTRQEFLIFETN